MPRNPRKAEEIFIAEGARAVEAILASPLVVRALVKLEEAPAGPGRIKALCDAAIRRGLEVRTVSPRHAHKYFRTQTPQGIAAVVEIPAAPPLARLFADSRRILVLDGVGDPGNAGSLVRTAYLLGWDAALFTPGSVSPWNEKTVRASAGAVGFLPLGRFSAAEISGAAAGRGWRLLLAAPGAAAAAERAADRICLVLGGEAHGPAAAWPGAAPVAIPMTSSAVGSLGVLAAGAILLEELRVP